MFETFRKLSLPRPVLFTRPVAKPERPDAAAPAPRTLFFEAVDRVVRRDRLPFHLAMEKVRRQEHDLFEAAFPYDRRRAPLSSGRAEPRPCADAAHRESHRELLAA